MSSIIAISQVEYLAIIDNLAGLPHNNIICHVSIALVFQYSTFIDDNLEVYLAIIDKVDSYYFYIKTACPVAFYR